MAALTIRYGVGVQVRQTVQIVEVDEDFFEWGLPAEGWCRWSLRGFAPKR